jgi:two-component system alkaline phosphatase synthesis response regulator PhoP
VLARENGRAYDFDMRNLLLVGDIETLSPYAEALESAGFFPKVRPAGDEELLREEHDLAVIDLPSLAEDATVRELLANVEATPVIVIANPEQLEAFEPIRDADDFHRKGAPAEELVARVRRVLWKRHRVDARNLLKVGDLVMDLGNYTVQIAGRTVDLTYKEYELLRFLATNRERVYSRETLLSKVWGYDFYGGARTVDVHIRRLRSKIEDRTHTFIETVRNVGYRFRAG